MRLHYKELHYILRKHPLLLVLTCINYLFLLTYVFLICTYVIIWEAAVITGLAYWSCDLEGLLQTSLYARFWLISNMYLSNIHILLRKQSYVYCITVWPGPIWIKVKKSWLLLPQYQSKYPRGPESASIEIPPFRPKFTY